MELLKKRLANLLSVKSIVTLCLTITFCVLTVQAKVTQEFNTVYLMAIAFFFFKQKTAYEIYRCDWSSDVCSSDLIKYTVVETTNVDGYTASVSGNAE